MNKFHINNCTASDGFIMQRMEIINSSEQLYRERPRKSGFRLRNYLGRDFNVGVEGRYEEERGGCCKLNKERKGSRYNNQTWEFATHRELGEPWSCPSDRQTPLRKIFRV